MYGEHEVLISCSSVKYYIVYSTLPREWLADYLLWYIYRCVCMCVRACVCVCVCVCVGGGGVWRVYLVVLYIVRTRLGNVCSPPLIQNFSTHLVNYGAWVLMPDSPFCFESNQSLCFFYDKPALVLTLALKGDRQPYKPMVTKCLEAYIHHQTTVNWPE